MATKQEKIEGLTRGNDYTFRFNVVVPAAIISARFVVKQVITDPDNVAIVNKLVGTTSSNDGQIVDQGGEGRVAIVKFFLTKSETNAFEADEEHVWDMEVFDSFGNAATPVGGTIMFEERVRTAIG